MTEGEEELSENLKNSQDNFQFIIGKKHFKHLSQRKGQTGIKNNFHSKKNSVLIRPSETK